MSDLLCACTCCRAVLCRHRSCLQLFRFREYLLVLSIFSLFGTPIRFLLVNRCSC